jgi:tRNA threonylcarbamoyladenosine biosynthesis protein TsaE
MSSRTLITRSEDETRAEGTTLARGLQAGDVILLTGDLGMGKTVFARGIAQGLDVPDDEVRSPSFTLVNRYRGRMTLYHIDLYRIDRPEDLDELGLEEILGVNGVAVVEWAERLGPYRAERVVAVHITDRGGSDREITIDDRRSDHSIR